MTKTNRKLALYSENKSMIEMNQKVIGSNPFFRKKNIIQI